jgi:hypothetical protein
LVNAERQARPDIAFLVGVLSLASSITDQVAENPIFAGF